MTYNLNTAEFQSTPQPSGLLSLPRRVFEMAGNFIALLAIAREIDFETRSGSISDPQTIIDRLK